MRLQKLSLRNFKGIRDLAIDFSGGNVNIYGDNATGKTTVFDAFTWLLFDKDSLNRKDFGIKTLDSNGEAIHGLEHEVSAEFTDGLSLRKVYYEKWTKQKGASEKVFSGHTVDYFVNDVPAKKSEYQTAIDGVVKEDIFKLLSNPLFFNTQLHWQDRRKILFEVCGDVSDADVIAFCEPLAELAELVGNRSIDDHKKMTAAKLKEINQELERIPVRIDEVNKSIATVDNLNKEDLTAALEGLNIRKREKESELSQLENGGQAAVIKKQTLELENELQGIVNKYRQADADETIQQQKRYTELSKTYSNKLVEVRNMEGIIFQTQTKINNLNNTLKELVEIFKAKNVAQPSVDDACPTCRQSLPAEQVEDAIKKFNAQKAAELTKINNDGKSARSELENLNTSMADMQKRFEDAKNELAVLEQQRGVMSIDKVVTPQEFIETVPQYKELYDKLQKLKESPLEDNIDAKAEIRNGLQVIEGDMYQIRNQLASIEAAEKSKERIEELKQQERKLADEHRQYSKQAYLCDEFVRTKTTLVTDKINSKFALARFRLFEQQINGGLTESCESVYDGVPYSDLNNAMKINIGLDIVNTLAAHYGAEVPVFIDNAEGVTNVYKLDMQMVRLVVSEQNKKLTIVTDNKNVAQIA